MRACSAASRAWARTHTSTPEGTTAYLDADLRVTAAILRAVARTLDFREPIALLLLIILHLVLRVGQATEHGVMDALGSGCLRPFKDPTLPPQ